jgi:peptidyl-dipeptidase Dcp
VEIAPKLATHRDAVYLNAELFARIEALHAELPQLELDSESEFLIKRYYKDFVRAGAKLSEEDKTKLKALNAELATLQTAFQQNVLNEVNAATIFIDDPAELKGLPRAPSPRQPLRQRRKGGSANTRCDC